MIGACEMEAIRDTLTASLPDEVVIVRVTTTSDGMGGMSEAWAAAGTVSARVSPGGGEGVSTITGDRLIESSPWVVTLPYGTDITDRDRITFGAMSLEVTKTDAPRSLGACVRAGCEEVS